jgi:hypothetical protein
MKYTDLLINSNDFDSKSLLTKESIEKVESILSDYSYFSFIEKVNGGFFYDYSLQLYSINTSFEFHDIIKVNEVIKKEYGGIVADDFFFGQEIFGNQFGYSNDGIIFLNSETGEREKIANNFDDWIEVLKADLDYLTGKNIAKVWNNSNVSFTPNERLYPKKPFVMGGEYKIENLFPLGYPKYISAYANIANQIHNLPNGTKLKLKIIE